ETTVAVPGGSESRPKAVTTPLNFEISDPSQGPFKLAKISGPSMLGTKSSDTNFPYAIGNSGEVTNGVSGSSLSESSTYYYFYDWTVGASIPLCESDRQ